MPNIVKYDVGRMTEDGFGSEYEWAFNPERLRSVKLNGKTITYGYHTSGRLKSRKVNNDLYEFSDSGWPSGTLNVSLNGQQIEEYKFLNNILVEFTINNNRYLVRDQIFAMVLENTLGPPGTAGPLPKRIKHVYLFNKYARVMVVLDGDLKVTNEKPLPRFLYFSQYYDEDTELYYFRPNVWFHPKLKKTLKSSQTPMFILPEPPPPKGHGWKISPAPRMLNLHALKMRLYEEQGVRISGSLRVSSGVVFLTISIPMSATGAGAIIGVPLTLWSADQIGTGLSEVLINKSFTSRGGKIIQHVAGDGTVGQVLTFAYDVGPDAVMGVKALAQLGRGGTRIALKEATAAKRVYLNRGLREVAARNTLDLSSRANARIAREVLSSSLHLKPSEALLASQALQKSINAIPDGSAFSGLTRTTRAPVDRSSLVGFGSLTIRTPHPSRAGRMPGSSAIRKFHGSFGEGNHGMRIVTGNRVYRRFPGIGADHHIATNKSSQLTPYFRELYRRAGRSLNEESNIVRFLVGHDQYAYMGHSPAYHLWIYESLVKNTSNLSGTTLGNLLRQREKAIGFILRRHPELLKSEKVIRIDPDRFVNLWR